MNQQDFKTGNPAIDKHLTGLMNELDSIVKSAESKFMKHASNMTKEDAAKAAEQIKQISPELAAMVKTGNINLNDLRTQIRNRHGH